MFVGNRLSYRVDDIDLVSEEGLLRVKVVCVVRSCIYFAKNVPKIWHFASYVLGEANAIKTEALIDKSLMKIQIYQLKPKPGPYLTQQ